MPKVSNPLGPAEIKAAFRERGPHCARYVWPSFGPIEAESAEVAAGRTQRGKVDPELGEKTGACCGDFSGFVAEHDIFVGNEEMSEVHAETTGKVVVADSGRTTVSSRAWRDRGQYRGLCASATATIPSSISTTFADASRQYRCRPSRVPESKPVSIS